MKKLICGLFIVTALSAAMLVDARLSAKKDDFRQAADFPREALIYVQVRDLPELIRLWNESELRRKYLESANYRDFANNHLALKLAERAAEIEFGLGVFPDLGFASALSEKSAAFAVYDVGKMEFVFIAPMSEERILASALFKIQSGFEERELEDGTLCYTKEIEVDRARQRQKVLFASFRGRLILSTSEKYFLQTLANIRSTSPKNRLSDEPLFSRAAERTVPHLATVWLNQEKLNADWYFRHYWLMSEIENLKQLRAGMFDFEMDGTKIIERRAFLTGENKPSAAIRPETARRLAGLIPDTAQFSRIEPLAKLESEASLLDALFDAPTISPDFENARARKDFYFRDWEKSYSYSYLDEDFSAEVDDVFEDDRTANKPARRAGENLAGIINAARPQASVTLFSPRSLAPPLFFDNRKALVISLREPARLDQQKLESELSSAARELLTVNDQKADFGWTNFSDGETAARQMALPSLGWRIYYARRGGELIFSGSEDFLREILDARPAKPDPGDAFEKLTRIDLKNGSEHFKSIFETIEADEKFSGYADNTRFFTGNLASLLDVVSGVEKIEIRQTSAPNFLFEELDFYLKKDD